MENAKKHSYLFFLGIATAYLIFYTIYYVSPQFNKFLFDYDKLLSYLSQVSILFFTVGIFGVGLKYLQLLKVFRAEFHEAINSSEFENKLKSNLKAITFSEEYLLGQSDLTALWETITLCLYRKEFPQIHEKVKKQIKNDFFKKSNISYFYRNFQLNYKISLLEGKYLRISEKASYTLIRPNTEEFSWDFGFASKINDDGKTCININGNILTCEQKITEDHISSPASDTHVIKKVTMTLSGHLEYTIERDIEIVQDIFVDNLHSFSSDRIIDDLTVNIEHDDTIDAFFTPVNKQKFYHNGAYELSKKAFINRDIFLQGEKFIIFFTIK